MKLFLISNNLMATNLYYEDELNIEKKKAFRPLSIEGEKLACKLVQEECFNDIERIYADESNSSITSANYLASKLNLDLVVNSKINDFKVGDLQNKTLKMLSYFQEHNFDFKTEGGESLNECQKRIDNFIKKLIMDDYEKVCIYLPKKCLMSYLLKYTKQEFNLEDNLILEYKDNIIMGDIESDIDIFELLFEGLDLKGIKVINLK